MKISERIYDFSSNFLANFGAFLFVNHPANKGKKRDSANNIIIFPTGISNLDTSTKRNTSEGKINGTAIDVEIIIPTTNGSLLLFSNTLITNGAPSPVDIPESKSTESAKEG